MVQNSLQVFKGKENMLQKLPPVSMETSIARFLPFGKLAILPYMKSAPLFLSFLLSFIIVVHIQSTFVGLCVRMEEELTLLLGCDKY